MNKIVLALLATCLFLISCNREEEVPGTGMGEGIISLKLEFQDPQEIVTRTVHEYKIYNITIMTFDEHGSLVSRRHAFYNDPLNENSLTVDDITIKEKGSLYAIANIGHNSSDDNNSFEKIFLHVSDEKSLLALVETTKIYRDIPVTTVGGGTGIQALVMVGKTTFPTLISGELTIPMQRISAKVKATIQVNSGVDSGFKLVGARMSCLPNACHLIPRNDDLPLGDVNYFVSDWFAPAAGNRSLVVDSFYVYENHKGTGPDKSNLKVGDVITKNATYLEILATYQGDEYVYKVYLGTDNTTNYDIDRNTNYDVTVDITGLTEMATDIRISRFFKPKDDDPKKVDWYITDGLLLHYDGIKNNGDDPRVTNATKDIITDPNRPTAVGGSLTNFYYDYSGIVGGYTPVQTLSPHTDGKKNRWKNLAPATYGTYNIPIYPIAATGKMTTDEKSPIWGPDCLSLNGKFIASMEICDARIFAETFTVECVFMANENNLASGGNDLFAFWHTPAGPRYVIADVETYQNGLGFIAGGNWNGMNYGTTLLINRKHRVVVQFDGQQLIAWMGNKTVFTEQKVSDGAIPWQKGPLGSPGPNCPVAKGTAAPYATQLTLGSWVRHYASETFNGNIYSFRYYNRVLTKNELDYNFSLDMRRYGVVNIL